MTTTAGFIGLGNMGLPMARSMLKNSVKLFVYNRTKEKAFPLQQEGATLVETPRDLFPNTSIIFSMVANDEALEAVTLGPTGILATAKPGTIHVSMSTVSPSLIHDLQIEHQKKGVSLLSAPVFGRPDAAAAQKLTICVAGEEKAKKEAEPLLRFMGQKLFDLGKIPEQANCVKVAGNFIILSNVEIFAEAFAYIQKSGADLNAFYTLLDEALFSSSIIKKYGKRLLEHDYKEGGFRMELGHKDINLLLQSANQTKVPMPIANLLHDRLVSGLAKNRGNLDWSAIFVSVFEDANLM